MPPDTNSPLRPGFVSPNSLSTRLPVMSERLMVDSLVLKILFTVCKLSQQVTRYLGHHIPMFAPLPPSLVHAAVVTKLAETVLNLAIPEDIHPHRS